MNLLVHYVVQAAVFVLFLAMIAAMAYRHRHGQRQGDGNLDGDFGVANTRVPPSWCPEEDRRYPFRSYEQDLLLWAAATDIDPARRAPAAVLRLTGAARLVAREIDTAVLQNGVMIQGMPADGIHALLHVLRTRYAPLEQEIQVHVVSELMQFSRMSGESTDELLARFEVVNNRAANLAQVDLGFILKSWMLLSALRVPLNSWSILLSPTEGQLPQDDIEFTAFKAYLRRNGHVYEAKGHDEQKSLTQPFFTNQSSNQGSTSLFPTWQGTQQSNPLTGHGWFQTMPNTSLFPTTTSNENDGWSSCDSLDSDELTWDDVATSYQQNATQQDVLISSIFNTDLPNVVGANPSISQDGRSRGKARVRENMVHRGTRDSKDRTRQSHSSL